jgi:hypothetical protein
LSSSSSPSLQLSPPSSLSSSSSCRDAPTPLTPYDSGLDNYFSHYPEVEEEGEDDISLMPLKKKGIHMYIYIYMHIFIYRYPFQIGEDEISLMPLKTKGILKKSSQIIANSPRTYGTYGSLGELSVTWDQESINKSGKGSSFHKLLPESISGNGMHINIDIFLFTYLYKHMCIYVIYFYIYAYTDISMDDI